MKLRGQALIIVAVALTVGLLVLALAVDGGRIYLERAELRRSAQASADAGIGWVSERMVTLVVPRQTEAALRAPCMPDGDFGSESASCTATPEPKDISHWLTDDDRATLVAPAVRATAQAIAQEYAERNGVRRSDPEVTAFHVRYPYGYDPDGPSLRMWVQLRRKTVILLAGLLGESFVELPAEGLSEVPQR